MNAYNLPKTWTEIKNIISANSMYFYYEDLPDQGRLVIVPRDSIILYECFLALGSSDWTDFDTNWKSKSGGKTAFIKGYFYNALTFNSWNTFDILLTKPDGTNVDTFLFKGTVGFKDSLMGDRLQIQAIDIDNVIGYGANTVLLTILDIVVDQDGTSHLIVEPQSSDYFVIRRKLPQGIYIRVKYQSTSLTVAPALALNFYYSY